MKPGLSTTAVNRHIPALDGLRGVAVMLVILCHVNWAFGGPFTTGRINGPVATIFGASWVGVELFFVLSGFLITGILLEAKGSDGYFRNFYARRTLRIMPLYYGFLFATLLAWPMGFNKDLNHDDILSLLLYYYNWHAADTHRTLGIYHPFWSLAIEEHFYLLWPLLIWALPRRALLVAIAILGLCGVLLRVLLLNQGFWPMSVFFVTPCHLDALLAGALVATAVRDQNLAPWVGRLALPTVVLASLVLTWIAWQQGHFIPDGENSTPLLTAGLPALALLFAGILVLSLRGNAANPLRRALEHRGLCSVGKYSYASYVFHSLILAALVAPLPALRQLEAFLAKPIAAALVLGISFVAAWFSYHLFEKHFLSLKRYFAFRPTASTPSLLQA